MTSIQMHTCISVSWKQFNISRTNFQIWLYVFLHSCWWTQWSSASCMYGVSSTKIRSSPSGLAHSSRWARNQPRGDIIKLCKLHTYKADSRLAPCQWETSLQSNAVSHRLGANLESALTYIQSISFLAPWGLKKMAWILQTIFWNAFF